jgi:hypothetical protein
MSRVKGYRSTSQFVIRDAMLFRSDWDELSELSRP